MLSSPVINCNKFLPLQLDPPLYRHVVQLSHLLSREIRACIPLCIADGVWLGAAPAMQGQSALSRVRDAVVTSMHVH